MSDSWVTLVTAILLYSVIHDSIVVTPASLSDAAACQRRVYRQSPFVSSLSRHLIDSLNSKVMKHTVLLTLILRAYRR